MIFDSIWVKCLIEGNVAEKKPWMNKLKLIQDLAATNASSARIFKAIADPPTTSLQRLKVSQLSLAMLF